MQEEIEAAVLFITNLVNKNLSQFDGSSASSTHSHSSASTSSSASDASSDNSAGFDEQASIGSNAGSEIDKVEQFRQCLTNALYERYHNHWFPDQPTKGQAYRCIRLNEWDRHDSVLQKACAECGIEYKDLQLPIELTLWVDPDEVTYRIGESGSHCLVEISKDGQSKYGSCNHENDTSNHVSDYEVYRQGATEKMMQLSLNGSPDYNKHRQNMNQNAHNYQTHNANNIGSPKSGYQYLHHAHNTHQTQKQPETPTHHQQHRSNYERTPIIQTNLLQQQTYITGCDTIGYYQF